MTTYAYDNVSRLNQLVQNLNGSGSDLTLDFTHNPAGEIHSNTRSNDSYSYTGHANANVTGTANGLNQLTNVGGTSNSHDARGNVSAIGSSSYGYSSENMLTTGPSSTTLGYDPLNRLHQTAGGSTTRFGYDGVEMVAEYDNSNALQRRYVFGPGTDEPLVWYEGSGTSTRRYFHADERGSVVAVSDASGDVVTAVNRYDEYGNVQGTLTGRFGYTGQAWIPELGMWYYRARMYNPALRFMQTDPIGFGGGMNLYAYVGNNPVNFIDPMGQKKVCVQEPQSRMSRCVEVDDENGDGKTDSSERASAEAWLRFQFSNPELFQSNSQEMIDYERAIAAQAQMLDASGFHYYQDTAMTRAMDRDARDFLTGRISEREFWLRARARAGGVAGGMLLLGGGYATAILARAGWYAIGPSGPLFGSSFYRGMGNSGFFNYGNIRLGWSYHQPSGMLEFTLRIGNRHYPPIVVMRPPRR